jgi:hypothetical protein
MSFGNRNSGEWYDDIDIDIDGCDSNGDHWLAKDRVDDNYGAGYVIDEPTYMYQFKNKETLASSAVFQECLGQALAHKDKTIRDLQNELLATL